MELLARTGVGRDINRHYYTAAEIETALRNPLLQKQIELIRLRNTHPAFAGEFQVEVPAENQIQMHWRLQEHWVRLRADLSVPSASITGSSPNGKMQRMAISEASGPGVGF
jgi:sucrose phosphorylase